MTPLVVSLAAVALLAALIAGLMLRGSWRQRPRVIAVLGILALGVAGYLVAALAADSARLLAALHSLGPFGLLLVLGASLVNYALRFQRWAGYLANLGHVLPGGPHLLIYLAGFAFTVSPGKAGEAVRSLYLRDRYAVPYADSMAALFVERLLDVLAIAVLGSLVVLQARHWWPAPLASLALVISVQLVPPLVLKYSWPLALLKPVMAMPFSALASTSVTPPTKLLSSTPTAPTGVAEPWITADRSSTVLARTGASLTAVTLMVMVNWI